ncbi:MAG: signal peptidase I [Elusimicrobia bacterium]|nr:signal peptidase I [Elusimicrobiota bacterium]
MKRLIFLIALGLAGAYFFRHYVGGLVRVASGSMEPTLELNSFQWLNRWYYYIYPIDRGDIIVFPSPVDRNKDLIKRVIGLPGDSVQIINKEVFLNYKKFNEPYVIHKRRNEILVGDNMQEVIVPENSLFVMGDNRDFSEDSRDWKDKNGKHIYFISVDSVEGRIFH